MSGDADIVAEVRDGALIVPEAALLYEGDDGAGRGGRARLARRTWSARPVRTGIFNGDRVEIVDGLAEGDEVKLQ